MISKENGRISITLSKHDIERIDDLRMNTGATRSAFISRAIREKLERDESRVYDEADDEARVDMEGR